MRSWAVFDVEGDGLKPTKIYCLSYMDNAGHRKTLTEYTDIQEFFKTYDVYVGHNIIRWDMPQLVRLVLGEMPDKDFYDTLGLAWVFHPDRGKWDLESYGPDYGVEKPPITDWVNLSLDEYIHRCQEDVLITFSLWQDLLEYAKLLYTDHDTMENFFKYVTFKLTCAQIAEENRWRLDVDFCQRRLEELSAEREEKYHALAAVMPKIPVVKKHKPPARPYRADGEPSVLGQRWQDRLKERGLPPDYDGTLDEVTGYIGGNPGSPHQIKAWLFSLGWKPRTFKYVPDKDTGELREIPQINQERGAGICESIKDLYDIEPDLELLDGLSILKHRCDLLSGFLRDCDSDGFLYGGVAGFTNTLRFRHAVLVNLPKPEVKYGYDIRACLIARDIDHLLCGSDMSGLEDRLKQHFLYPHDPDYVDSLQSDDYDPHIDIAVLAGMMTPEDQKDYSAGIRVKELKPIRSTAKNGNYACQYGAGPPRIALTCGIDLDAASTLHQAYWKRNWAIKVVAKEQTTKTVRGQMWLLNPINGFYYALRHHKDIFSTLIQGTAVFCFDLYLKSCMSLGVQNLLGQFHDEFIAEISKTEVEETKTKVRQAIDCVNDTLQLNVKLDVGLDFGNNYAEIH